MFIWRKIWNQGEMRDLSRCPTKLENDHKRSVVDELGLDIRVGRAFHEEENKGQPHTYRSWKKEKTHTIGNLVNKW